MATKCVKEALSYDVRILQFDVLAPLLQQHHDIMEELMCTIAGVQLSAESWQRVQLPGPLSGAGVTLSKDSAEAAFVATWQAVVHRVSVVAEELGRPAPRRIDEAAYEDAVRRLHEKGIKVEQTGKVQFTDAGLQYYSAGPWSADADAAAATL